jgi:hypothetical protein
MVRGQTSSKLSTGKKVERELSLYNLKMKRKSFYIAIIVSAVLILGGFFLFKNYYYSWRIGYQWKKFETEFTNYLKDDKYGGKTPEETYNMFIGALKSGDVEIASKYFYWEKQVDEQSRLQKMEDEGKLGDYINNLPKWGDLRETNNYNVEGEKKYMWMGISTESIIAKLPKGDGTYFEEIIPPGEYISEIIFQLNKQANIWKIYSL